MPEDPPPLPRDARGIVDLAAMAPVVRLTRYPAGPVLAELVEWFWAARWQLPAGVVHEQQVLTHPGANLAVGHSEPAPDGTTRLEATFHGVSTRLSTRRLSGTGWTVAALTFPGGAGALVTRAGRELVDRVLPLAEVLPARGAGADRPGLLAEVAAAEDEASRVDRLRTELETVLSRAPAARVEAARQVARVARLAAGDASLRRVEDLADAAGTTPRTLQRMFIQHAGVSPTWVLRRQRLLEAAEAARTGGGLPWSLLAATLGYADQAHLVRDFRSHLGRTPTQYLAGTG